MKAWMGSILGLVAATAAFGAEPVDVGVAQRDVTPSYPVRLSGYQARKAESKGVQQRLRAKGLAIGSDKQGAALLITVDTLGVPATVVEEVAGRLKAKAGLARERFAVASSHTHSAPCLTGLAPNIFAMKLPEAEQAAIDRYTKELTDHLEAVGLDALKDRRPATLAWSQGTVGFAINRRVVKDSRWTGFGEVADGPVDHSLPMLRAVDADGKVRAVVVAYACHCTTLNPADNLLSGDWAGYAQEEIERDHPGAIALTLIGCAGDANPRDRTGVAVAQRHGRTLADEVGRLLKGDLKPLAGPPIGRFKTIPLPFDTLPTRAELEALTKGKDTAAAYNARTMLDRLDRGESLPTTVEYPVQTWQFGDDCLIVFLGGEVVVDYAIRLRRELDAGRLWVVAYANDVPCYIPSERILKEGGYEGGGSMVYYGKPTRLAPGVEDRIVAAVRELTPPQFLSKSK
ncbi:MAG TPA: neutral/alkaline non-lysosomal ceramidase N-terminal domain-containing protein [Isosphaeraceae bacterium]|jgi:hypothetical protein|nr:neutral/alkaline non-lysosomal ceramidase N-terminal domain-containing protein [Isosphaeraceae bacterium]